MLIKGDYENLEQQEVRQFNYRAMAEELGEFPRYKNFDGWECEEVLFTEEIDGEEVTTQGWQIIGTNRVVEHQWTSPKQY